MRNSSARSARRRSWTWPTNWVSESKLDAFCSVTLGSVAVNNLEMTNAYATLAAHGMRHRATPVLEVTRQNGDPIQKHFSPPGEQVLDANYADEVTYALRSVVTGGTGYAADLGWPYYVYGKTGTAQDNVDAWFCGYTQEISTCVWVGYPKEQTPLLYVEGVPAVYGGTIPAAIWHDYMLARCSSTPRRARTTCRNSRGRLGPVCTGCESHPCADRDRKRPHPRPNRHPRMIHRRRMIPRPRRRRVRRWNRRRSFKSTAILPPENDRPTLGRHRQLTHRHAPKR